MTFSERLLVRQAEPFNAGTPLDLMTDNFITPEEIFFVRSHGNVPEVDPDSYRLHIGGLVDAPVALSLTEILRDFTSVEVVATIQCAGNRRNELKQIADMPGELPWHADAISTAIWRGVPLRAVLARAGLKPEAQHVAFTGLDTVHRHGHDFSFGGSIEIAKALSAETLLAYEMNGKPLTPSHGAPLRLVVPGYIGARSIKWLAGINVQETPSDNYFQQHAYKMFTPDVNSANVKWDAGQMLSGFRLNSALCVPQADDKIPAGKVTLKGYAIASPNAKLTRVEVSPDGGASWLPANVQNQQNWTWALWQIELELGAGQHEIVVRAFDSDGNAQPESLAEVWNFKGYLNNAWQRTTLRVAG
jgi:sulfite oxidase